MNEMWKAYKGCYTTKTKEISFNDYEPQEVLKDVFKEGKEKSYKCLMEWSPKHGWMKLHVKCGHSL